MDHYFELLRDKMIRETEQFLDQHLNQNVRALAAEPRSPPSGKPLAPRAFENSPSPQPHQSRVLEKYMGQSGMERSVAHRSA
jgi:hypothetical protein